MHRLQQTEGAFVQARKMAQLFGEACATFCLSNDERLRKGFTRLTRLLAAGPAEKAIETAAKLTALFETAARELFDVDHGDEVWASAAYCAAIDENYDLALRFAELSAKGERHLMLYQSLCEAERELNWLCPEESSLHQLETAEKLRWAMRGRNLLEIRRCLSMLHGPDDRNDGHSPGSGVPVRPRPPSLPAPEKRHWPDSPPPA